MTDRAFGFLNINKPKGLTSHDVVGKVRWLCRQKFGKTKVGHAGTLDPMATGVLVICVGYATRLSEYAMQSTKTYRATVYLGVETDTYDAEGETLKTVDATHISLDDVRAILPQFFGHIQQLPPMYSAIKKDGKKLYELARQGIEIEREPRAVTIHQIELVSWNSPEIVLDVTCGAGTYIRSLAHDIGEKLSVGAHLSGLIRTQSGYFSVDNAVTLDALVDNDSWHENIIEPANGLRDWNALQLTDHDASEIQLGRSIPKTDALQDDYIMAYMPNGHLLAVMENRDEHWKPHKVFLPQD